MNVLFVTKDTKENASTFFWLHLCNLGQAYTTGQFGKRIANKAFVNSTINDNFLLYFTKVMLERTMTSVSKKRIQNPVKHLRQIFLRK